MMEAWYFELLRFHLSDVSHESERNEIENINQLTPMHIWQEFAFSTYSNKQCWVELMLFYTTGVWLNLQRIRFFNLYNCIRDIFHNLLWVLLEIIMNQFFIMAMIHCMHLTYAIYIYMIYSDCKFLRKIHHFHYSS